MAGSGQALGHRAEGDIEDRGPGAARGRRARPQGLRAAPAGDQVEGDQVGPAAARSRAPGHRDGRAVEALTR